jgi:hypothetical protein
MSVLSLVKRPVVMFDPTEADHRKWFAEFLINHSWGNCPVRFTTQEKGDMIVAIQRKLLIYYSTLEFGYDIQRSYKSSAA